MARVCLFLVWIPIRYAAEDISSHIKQTRTLMRRRLAQLEQLLGEREYFGGILTRPRRRSHVRPASHEPDSCSLGRLDTIHWRLWSVLRRSGRRASIWLGSTRRHAEPGSLRCSHGSAAKDRCVCVIRTALRPADLIASRGASEAARAPAGRLNDWHCMLYSAIDRITIHVREQLGCYRASSFANDIQRPCACAGAHVTARACVRLLRQPVEC